MEHSCPTPFRCSPPTSSAAPLIVYQVKRPNSTSWLFRNWYALPYVASCYKEMAFFIRGVRTTDADQWLADADFRIWGAHPSVWLERIHTPALTEFLQWVYTLFVPAVLIVAIDALAQAVQGRFSILRFLNRAGLSGLLHRVYPGPGARTAVSSKTFATLPVAGFMVVSGHAEHPRPSGIVLITIAFRAGTRNSPSWRGGVAEWSRTGGSGSIWPTLRASFLLQFIFDTTIRLTCWPGSLLAVVLILTAPSAVPETVSKGAMIGRY